MNSTTRTALRVLIATPIAVSAIALGSATAHADGGPVPAGPGVIVAQPGDDPTPHGPGEIALPEPEPEPKPEGPGDIANPEPEPDPQPEGPGDITNPEDGDDPKPHGPGDITNPEDGDDPKPEGPGDLAIPDPQDGPEDGPAEPKDEADAPEGTTPADDAPVVEVADRDAVDVPTRIDAGAGSALAAEDEQGLELMWLLAGGGAVTAAGAVLARQRARRTR